MINRIKNFLTTGSILSSRNLTDFIRIIFARDQPPLTSLEKNQYAYPNANTQNEQKNIQNSNSSSSLYSTSYNNNKSPSYENEKSHPSSIPSVNPLLEPPVNPIPSNLVIENQVAHSPNCPRKKTLLRKQRHNT